MAAPLPARALVAVTLAVLGAGQAPTRVAAVDEVPPEAVQHILHESMTAIVADVDGDGVRDLVRVVPLDTGTQAVEVIAMRGGEPVEIGGGLLYRAASVDDHVAGNNPNEASLIPLTTRDPARLIAWQVDGRERVLIAAMQGEPGSVAIERACCMALWSLAPDGNAGTRLRLTQITSISAAEIVAADMDADGTDELVVAETPDPAAPDATRVTVLRWNGIGFDWLRAPADDRRIDGPLMILGDSDDHAGDEVGYTTPAERFDRIAGVLHRVALVGGRLRIDRAELPGVGSVVPMRGPAGGRLAVVGEGGVMLLDWPSGTRSPIVEATSERGGEPLGVLGSGRSARLLMLRGGAVDVLDAALQSRQGIAGGAAAARFWASPWPPYRGELPGGDASGLAGFVFGGRLLTAPRHGSTLAGVRDVAVLAGRGPVGLFGPRLAWAAVSAAPTLPVERRGGSLSAGAGAPSRIAIVRAGSVLHPEEDGGLLQPPVDGAVVDAGRPMRPVLLTAAGAEAAIAGPIGTEAMAIGQPGSPASAAVVGGRGVATITLVSDDPEATENRRFNVRLLVSTPAGHAYGATWDVQVIRQSPRLAASAPMVPLDFSVSLGGRTDPQVQVQVDGAPVDVAHDGSFQVDVGAGLLPRGVHVVATDRVGNTTELVLEVVGVFDYRRLPWIPIVAGLTLLAGAVAFLRAPRPTAASGRHPDEGVLEEIQ